jgi:hypothetical protein
MSGNTHEEYCREHCENRARIARSEADIQNVWTAIDSMKENINALTVKIAAIVGGISAVSAVVQVWIGANK